MQIILGILIPFIGTVLGSSMVFFMKKNLNNKIEKLLLGIASGVMIAASVWSLLIPSIEMSEEKNLIAWFPAVIGFSLGIIFLICIDFITFKLKNNNFKKIKKYFNKKTMLFLAVTLHNIPEGMAVGVVFAGVISGNSNISMLGAFTLAIGIAIQNLPEGAIISMPLKTSGISKKKAFLYGVISGIVEPIAGFITILLTSIIVPVLPYLLSFAAGAMIYVVTNELIPESQNDELPVIGTIGITIGFLLMMILDVTLG